MLDVLSPFLSVAAIVISTWSVYWTWQTFHLVPKRDVVRKYAAYSWRISDDGNGNASRAEFFDVFNEARVVFAGDQEVIDLLENMLNRDCKPSDHDVLIRKMAKAAKLKTDHWTDRAFELVLVDNKDLNRIPKCD